MKLNAVKKKPCAKCPYKLGLVKTPFNPCPECKMDGCYKSYEWFQKIWWQGKTSESSDR